MNRSILQSLIAISGIAIVNAAVAQDPAIPAPPSAPPAEGTTAYYEALKAKYDAEKAAADAKAAALAAKYPVFSDIKPSAGSITFGGADTSAVGRMLEYAAVRAAGEKIGAATGDACSEQKACLLTSRTDVATSAVESVWLSKSVASLRSAASNNRKRVAAANTAIDNLVKPVIRPATAGVLPGANAVLNAAAGIFGYFKSDFQVRNEQMTPVDEALLAATSASKPKAFVREGFNIPQKSSATLTEIDALMTELNQLNADLAPVKQKAEGLNDGQKKLLATHLTNLTEVASDITTAAGFIDKQLARSADGKPSMVERVVASEVIFTDRDKVLQVKVHDGGNVSIGQQGLFRRSKLTYVGTISVSYVLVDSTTAAIEKSGVITCSFPMKVYLGHVGNAKKKNTLKEDKSYIHCAPEEEKKP